MVVLAQVKTNTLKLDPLAPKPALIRGIERQRITARRTNRIVALYASGLSTREVAVKMGLSKTAVIRALKARGVAMRPRGGHHEAGQH